MKKRHSKGNTPRHDERTGGDYAAAVYSRFRVWVLSGLLLVLLVGVWLSGALAALPRSLARKSLEARDFEAASQWLAIADGLSQQDPSNALLAARVARWQGDGSRLARELQRAEQWGADAQAIRHEQLLAMAQSGELESIEGELVQWLADAGSEAAEVSEAYVNGLARAGRFEDAVSVLDAWRQDFPHDPRPDYRLGRIQEHQQLYTSAEASYRRSLDKRVDYYPARFSLGRVLRSRRRGEEAAEAFRACLAMPRSEAAQVELAIALKALGKAEEARPLLRQVLEGDLQRLEASYVALDERPEGFKAAAEYGRLEADAGNFAEAERWLRRALDAQPQDLLARYALAISLRGLGKQVEAEEHFARVRDSRKAMGAANALSDRIKRDPEDLEARFELGKLVLEHESERTGLYWIRSIFSFDEDYRPAHEYLANYYAARVRQHRHFADLAKFHRQKAATDSTPEETASR